MPHKLIIPPLAERFLLLLEQEDHKKARRYKYNTSLKLPINYCKDHETCGKTASPRLPGAGVFALIPLP